MTLFFTSFSLSLSYLKCLTVYCLVPGFGSTSGASCVSVGPRLRRRPGRCRSGRCRTALSTGPGESPGSADTPSGNGTSIFQISEKTFYFFFNFLLLKYWWETLAEKNLTFQANMGEVPPIRRARLLSWRTPLSDWTLLLSPPTFLPSVSPANKKTSPFGCFRQDRGLEGRKLEQKIRKRI